MAELYVLRHGETEWNRQGRMQGRLDSALTERGREQARRQGDLLSSVRGEARFWCSPQGRARETAKLALGRFGADIRFDERLCEIDIGSWSGLTRSEIAQRAPGDDGDDFLWMDGAPDGEGFAGVEARVRSLLADLADQGGQPTVIVTHGVLSRFLRGAVLGLDLDGIAVLPGGQGVIYHLRNGVQTRLA